MDEANQVDPVQQIGPSKQIVPGLMPQRSACFLRPAHQEPPRPHLVIVAPSRTGVRMKSLVAVALTSWRVESRSRAQLNWSTKMKNHVYKILEIVGSSQTSIEDAIGTAIELAGKTIRNMDWFEVVETRGHIKDGKIAHYQVTLKIGFTLETQ
jgi:flavin-binding protein dodecin